MAEAREQQIPKLDFEDQAFVREAKRYKADDKQIVDALAKRGRVVPRMLDYMRTDKGMSDEMIVHYLMTGRLMDSSTSPVSRGFGMGLTQVAGAPASLAETVGKGVQKYAPIGSSARNYLEGVDVNVPGTAKDIQQFGNRALGKDNYFPEGGIEDIPRADKPLYAAGEAMGANVLAIPPVQAAGRAGVFGRAIKDFTRTRPLASIGTEVGTATGAATGAALGEKFFGDKGPEGRIAGEIVGGFVNPLSWLFRGGSATLNKAWDFVSSFSEAATDRKAATWIQKTIIEAGEDPEKLIELLKRRSLLQDFNKVDRRTAAQFTGSPTFKRMERQLIKENAHLGRDVQEKALEASIASEEILQTLVAEGSPEAMKVAMRIRADRITNLMQARLDHASRKVSELRNKFPDPDDRQLSIISNRAYEILSDALADARKLETEAWSKVRQNVGIDDLSGIKNSSAKIDELTKDLAVTETLPPLLSDGIRALKKKVKVVKGSDGALVTESNLEAGDLIKWRSLLLDEARSARGKKEWRLARRYQEASDAVLEDLMAIDVPGYDLAKKTSKELNDVFSRTFAGRALNLGQEGQNVIEPELMLETAFGRGKSGLGTTGKVRLEQLENAAVFGGSSMAGVQDDFIRAAATKSMKDGEFNPAALATFLNNNQETLKRFPDLAKDLTNARKAELFLRGWDKTPRVTKLQNARAVFQKIAGSDDPISDVGMILQGKNPLQNFSKIANAAKAAEGGAKGLQATVVDWAFQQASRRGTADVDWMEFKRLMLTPVTSRGPSPLEVMRRTGVMTEPEAKRYRRLINEMALTFDKVRGRVDMTDATNPLYDLIVRITGAQLAATGISSSIGSSLIVAKEGSKQAVELFEKMPIGKVRDVLIEAAGDRQRMLDLLQIHSSPEKQKAAYKRIGTWLIAAGITAPEKISTSETKEP